MRHRLCPFFFALLLLAPPLHAAATETVSETAWIESVVDGDTLRLTDKRRVRLDGVNALEIPHRPEDNVRCLPSTRHPRSVTNGEDDFGCDLTLARAARSMLRELTVGKPVQLLLNPQRRTDRFGRLLAQIQVPDRQGHSQDVAAALLAAGLAHVYPLTGQEVNTPALLRAEDEARLARRGLWQLAEFQTIAPEQAADHYGHYVFIQGKVLKAAQIKQKIYLNFGEDYHTDFTAIVDRRDWKKFRDLDLLALTDKTIELRGYLYEDYGPALRLNNPEQLKVLE